MVPLTHSVIVDRDIPIIEEVVERFLICGSEEPYKGCNFVLLYASKNSRTCFRYKSVESHVRRRLGSFVRYGIQRLLYIAAKFYQNMLCQIRFYGRTGSPNALKMVLACFLDSLRSCEISAHKGLTQACDAPQSSIICLAYSKRCQTG